MPDRVPSSPHRRHVQFTLRGMFLATLLVAIALCAEKYTRFFESVVDFFVSVIYLAQFFGWPLAPAFAALACYGAGGVAFAMGKSRLGIWLTVMGLIAALSMVVLIFCVSLPRL
jgi:hypothetical protein